MEHLEKISYSELKARLRFSHNHLTVLKIDLEREQVYHDILIAVLRDRFEESLKSDPELRGLVK